MKQALLKAVNLSKSFGGVKAVDGVSFEVTEGEFVGLIGPNGSGKTTLVNLITGYIKPDRGKVFFKGKDITGKMPYTIANLGIARSFQMVKPFYQLPAFKNIVVALRSPRVIRQMRGTLLCHINQLLPCLMVI
jgi:branched-chain amino acid transport system ATP-binding protein